jgi:hypothetical protein
MKNGICDLHEFIHQGRDGEVRPHASPSRGGSPGIGGSMPEVRCQIAATGNSFLCKKVNENQWPLGKFPDLCRNGATEGHKNRAGRKPYAHFDPPAVFFP